MGWRGMRITWPRALLVTLGVVTLVVMLVAASTSTAAFGVYNPAWDGVGQLRDVAAEGNTNTVVALNTSAYGEADANRTVSVVLSPDEAYGNDTAALRRFVENGGTLVVAEDFGPHGNGLLQAVGASARFDGRIVRDERHYDRAPALPVATNVTEANGTGALTTGVDNVTLNYATVIVPHNATTLIATSEFAYLDANRNERVDEEPLRSYPVVTLERVGAGRVVAVSDPSLFINAMLDRAGNRRFTANLFDRETVILDYSHLGGQPPLTVVLLRVRAAPVLQGGLVALVIGIIFGGRHLLSGDRDESAPQRPERDRTIQVLARARDGDAERLRRATTGVWERGTDGDDNE